jgi:hypothetical protein
VLTRGIDSQLLNISQRQVNTPGIRQSKNTEVVVRPVTEANKLWLFVRELQSNRMFSCEQHCNIVPQYCNFDRQIALSKLQPTRTNCKLEIHKRFVNKASDWIITKREANQIV